MLNIRSILKVFKKLDPSPTARVIANRYTRFASSKPFLVERLSEATKTSPRSRLQAHPKPSLSQPTPSKSQTKSRSHAPRNLSLPPLSHQKRGFSPRTPPVPCSARALCGASLQVVPGATARRAPDHLPHHRARGGWGWGGLGEMHLGLQIQEDPHIFRRFLVGGGGGGGGQESFSCSTFT